MNKYKLKNARHEPSLKSKLAVMPDSHILASHLTRGRLTVLLVFPSRTIPLALRLELVGYRFFWFPLFRRFPCRWSSNSFSRALSPNDLL